MVQTKSKPRVQRQRLQVQRIFRIKLNAFQSRPDSPNFWLQLEGPRENMGKAKVNSVSPAPPVPSCQTPGPPRCQPRRRGPPRSPTWLRPCEGPVLDLPPPTSLSRSAALVPSLWLLPSFCPTPLFECHFSPSSVLREAPRVCTPGAFLGLCPSTHSSPPPPGEQLKLLHFCGLCNTPLCSPPRRSFCLFLSLLISLEPLRVPGLEGPLEMLLKQCPRLPTSCWGLERVRGLRAQAR